MKETSLRAALLAMLGFAVLCWALLAIDLQLHGRVSPAALAAAIVFTALLAAWPFLAGWRHREGHWRHAMACRDCGAARWPGADFGFCLRCGSLRAAAPRAY